MPEKKLHQCEPSGIPYGAYGPAILYCYESETGEFWVSNVEYESQVNFCPFCGTKAPTQADWDALAIAEQEANAKRREAWLALEACRVIDRAEDEARAKMVRDMAKEINADALYPCTDKVLEVAGWDTGLGKEVR